MSQEEMAKLVKCNKSTLCRLEKGKGGPSARVALRIHRATKGQVPTEAWMGGEDE